MANATFNLSNYLNTLSDDAVKVLWALVRSTEDYSYDFGMMDDAMDFSGFGRHKFAGHISHLQDAITWTESYTGDDFTTVSYTLLDCLMTDEAKATIEAYMEGAEPAAEPVAAVAAEPAAEPVAAAHNALLAAAAQAAAQAAQAAATAAQAAAQAAQAAADAAHAAQAAAATAEAAATMLARISQG